LRKEPISDPDVYEFIRGVVDTVKSTEAFADQHLHAMDQSMYMGIIEDVVARELHPEKIYFLYTGNTEKIIKEKTKRHPKWKRLKELRTKATAYQDVLEFMNSFMFMVLTPLGRRNIYYICRKPNARTK